MDYKKYASLTKEELETRVSMINEKVKQKEQLEYEIELIKNYCVDKYHHRGRFEISEFVDLHDAWLSQPKKIKHKNYTVKSINRSQYCRLMYWLQKQVFDDIIDSIKFYDRLIINGYGSVSITVPFKYFDTEFTLNIPNIQAICNFDDMMNYGFYEISLKTSEHSYLILDKFYRCDELKENIQYVLYKVLDEKLLKEAYEKEDK